MSSDFECAPFGYLMALSCTAQVHARLYQPFKTRCTGIAARATCFRAGRLQAFDGEGMYLEAEARCPGAPSFHTRVATHQPRVSWRQLFKAARKPFDKYGPMQNSPMLESLCGDDLYNGTKHSNAGNLCILQRQSNTYTYLAFTLHVPPRALPKLWPKLPL